MIKDWITYIKNWAKETRLRIFHLHEPIIYQITNYDELSAVIYFCPGCRNFLITIPDFCCLKQIPCMSIQWIIKLARYEKDEIIEEKKRILAKRMKMGTLTMKELETVADQLEIDW